jgi:hypothetical protein
MNTDVMSKKYYCRVFCSKISSKNIFFNKLDLSLLSKNVKNLNLITGRGDQYFLLWANVHVFNNFIASFNGVHGLCVLYLMAIDELTLVNKLRFRS